MTRGQYFWNFARTVGGDRAQWGVATEREVAVRVFPAILSVVCVGPALAGGPVLLLTDSAIVELDFATLTVGATRVGGVDEGVEMAASPSGDLYISRLSALGRVDLDAGTIEDVLSPAMVHQVGLFSGAIGGIAFDDGGQMVITLHAFPTQGGPTRNWYATWDLEAGERTGFLTPQPSFRQICFDLLVRDGQTLLAMDYREDRVWAIDRQTGEASVLAQADEGVSFLEYDDQLFLLTRTGLVQRFDAYTGALEDYGQISGLSGSLIGSAVLPVPGPGVWSGSLVLGTAGLRRRRRGLVR